MRIARSRYDSAKDKIAEREAELKKYRELVAQWEEAMEMADDPDEIAAININEDDEISLETFPKKKEDTNGNGSPENPAPAKTKAG